MEASGAGQMETFLGVSGIDKVSKNYQLISDILLILFALVLFVALYAKHVFFICYLHFHIC